MDGFILFILACLALGTLWRMALGQSAGEAFKNTFTVASAPARTAVKTANVARKWWWK